jgi:hypothetical protein
MKNLIAYIDLLARRYLAEEDELDDEFEIAWRRLTTDEKDVANHVAKMLAGQMGVDE